MDIDYVLKLLPFHKTPDGTYLLEENNGNFVLYDKHDQLLRIGKKYKMCSVHSTFTRHIHNGEQLLSVVNTIMEGIRFNRVN